MPVLKATVLTSLLLCSNVIAFAPSNIPRSIVGKLRTNINANALRKRPSSLFMSSYAPMIHTKCLYDLLGIARNADMRVVRQAYRKMAKHYHPGE